MYYGEGTNVVAEYWKGLPEVPDGYSYDFCSPHALLNCISVNNGNAVTATGMSYKVVVLGEHTQVMSIEVLRKLHQLVCGGVFLIGKEPSKPAGLGNDATEFAFLTADIWHSGRANVCTGTIAEGIRLAGIAPDFQTSAPGVRFVHRVDGNRHIYWVRNFSGGEVDADIVLRAGDRLIVPEYSGTVKINGEVMYPNTTGYVDGKSLKYYINQAGGFGDNAKKRHTYIIYMNGTVAKADRKHKPMPGCEIVVPTKQRGNKLSTAETLAIGSTTASLATMIATLVNLFK